METGEGARDGERWDTSKDEVIIITTRRHDIVLLIGVNLLPLLSIIGRAPGGSWLAIVIRGHLIIVVTLWVINCHLQDELLISALSSRMASLLHTLL